MKIAIVVGMFPKLSETFIVSQITGLIDRGHAVTIIAKEKAEAELQSAVADYNLLARTLYPTPLTSSRFLRVLRFCMEFLRHAARSPKRTLACLPLAVPFNSPGLQRFYFAALFLDREFDLVHCHFGFMGKIVAELAERDLIRCPVITSYHGTDIGIGASKQDFQQLHQRGAGFTTNSNFSADRAIRLGCPADRLDLLPVGLSLPRFPVSERRYRQGEPLRLLTVGRLIACKGIDIVLEAVSKLVARGLDVHLDIVGDGPQRGDLEQLAQQNGIAKLVTFHGAMLHEALVTRFHDAHLFILASTGTEGQGLVLQEAQATGLPVIASHCGGIPEGIADGESGLLFAEGDCEALVARILEMHASYQRWPEFGRKGRALVEQKFDIESLNDRLVEIYENAVLLS